MSASGQGWGLHTLGSRFPRLVSACSGLEADMGITGMGGKTNQ